MPSLNPSPEAVAPAAAASMSCPEMAARIREKGGKCGKVNRSTVWRIIQRLKLKPVFAHGSIKLYTATDIDLVIGMLGRRAPRNRSEKETE